MGSRGKESAVAGATLTVFELRRPAPPAELTGAESEIWKEVVGSMPADWIRKAFFPLLVGFCRHSARAAVLAEQINSFKPEWLSADGGLARYDKMLAMAERETRALNACARSLRMTPQSQITPKAAGTAMKRSRDGKKPWD